MTYQNESQPNNVLSTYQISQTITGLQEKFPEANIDINRQLAIAENLKKGILPDSMKAGASLSESPSVTYTKTNGNDITYLKVYQDLSLETWGKSGGTSYTSGTQTYYSNVSINYNNAYVWMVSYYVNYYTDSRGAVYNTVTSVGQMYLAAYSVPVSCSHTIFTATGLANLCNFLDFQYGIQTPENGLTLTFDIYNNTVNRTIGLVF